MPSGSSFEVLAWMRCGICFLLGAVLLAACGTKGGVTAGGGMPAAAQGSAYALSPAEERLYEEFFYAGLTQKSLEHYDAYYELLTEALRVHPNAPEALFEMAQLNFAMASYGDTVLTQRADSLMLRAVSLAPDNYYYKETLARTLYYQGRLAETIALYEDIAAAKQTTNTYQVLASLYSQAGNTEGALHALTRIETLEGRSEETALQKFELYHQSGDDESAFRTMEELCAEYPLDLRYRVLLGDMYDKQGAHEQALYIYKDVLTLEPQNPYAQVSLLSYYHSAGADSLYRDFLRTVVLDAKTQPSTRTEVLRAFCAESTQRARRAENFLRDSAYLAPLFAAAMRLPQEDHALAELNAAHLAAYGHSDEEIEQALRRIVEISPAYTHGRLMLLQNILMRSDYSQPQHGVLAEVVDICRTGEIYDPSEATLYYFEGVALHRQKKTDAAIEALRRGAANIDEETDPETASNLYALLGDILHEAGHTEEAFDAYEASLSQNPLNLLAMNNYAYFLSLASRDLEKAAAMAARVVDIEPANATYLDTYAWILYQQRKYAEASLYIERAIAASTEADLDATLLEHAGDIQFRLGNRAEAVNFWKRALPLATDDAQQRRTLKQKIARRRL